MLTLGGGFPNESLRLGMLEAKPFMGSHLATASVPSLGAGVSFCEVRASRRDRLSACHLSAFSSKLPVGFSLLPWSS